MKPQFRWTAREKSSILSMKSVYAGIAGVVGYIFLTQYAIPIIPIHPYILAFIGGITGFVIGDMIS